MGKVLAIVVLFLGIQKGFADVVFYLNQDKNCSIKLFKEGKLTEVSSGPFLERPIEVKVLPKNPSIVAFKENGEIFITPAICVSSNNSNFEIKASIFDSFLSKEHFVEFDAGTFSVGDESQVSRDYNETFPSSTSNPTSWSKASSSKYKAGALFSAGIGFRQTPVRFFMLKIRSMSGKKIDTLSLTDIDSGLSETGDWIYSDSFLNLYGGYRFQFFSHSRWKPSLAGFLGISKTSTTLTDNSVTYKLSSLGLAVLVEAGLEYLVVESFSLNGSIGLEYLGTRNLKFEDGPGAQGIKTKMSYNNTYLAMGIKYYF